MLFEGKGQQQDLLFIIVAHKATHEDVPHLLLLRLAVTMQRSWGCAARSFRVEESTWAAHGAFKLRGR